VPRTVTAFSNPTIRRLRALDDRKGRRAEGLFLAEGLRMAGEALDAGHVPAVVALTADAAAHPIGARVAAACEAAGGEALIVPRELLAKVTAKDNPAGCASAFRLWPTGLGQLDPRSAPLWLAAEGLRDPGNLGTMLRTCDAVGAGGLILLGQAADPFGVEACAPRWARSSPWRPRRPRSRPSWAGRAPGAPRSSPRCWRPTRRTIAVWLTARRSSR
jgi:TrmH family RNA methyltransferase